MRNYERLRTANGVLRYACKAAEKPRYSFPFEVVRLVRSEEAAAMASLEAPPGHDGQEQILIIAKLAAYPIAVQPTNAAVQDPILSTPAGQMRSTPAVARYIARQGSNASLYPKSSGVLTAQIDQWVDFASSFNVTTKEWHQQCPHEARLKARENIEAYLALLDAYLQNHTYLVGNTLSLADVLLSTGSLRALYQSTLGRTQQIQLYPNVTRWMTLCLKQPAFESVIGEFCPHSDPDGWKVQAVDAGLEQKESAGDKAALKVVAPGPQANGVEHAAPAEEDPVKKAKKAEKAAAKDAKKLKAEAKAKAKEAISTDASGGGNEKKAKAKAEAEAKKALEAEENAAVLQAAMATPKGHKKDTTAPMAKGYLPKAVEAAWYEWWEASGFFEPGTDESKPTFSMVIPPPNITGSLHLGHALTNSIQDTLIRWKRMKGFNTLWLPGTDHAGIATQVVVEKKIQREQGLSRHDLGTGAGGAEVASAAASWNMPLELNSDLSLASMPRSMQTCS